jgi:hypothetical protein
MPRWTYVSAFVLLAVTFVPVLFFFITGGLVAPCCYEAFTILEGKPGLVGLRLLYLFLYLVLFYLLARISFSLSSLPANRTAQVGVQILFLLLLFSCSYLRIIHETTFEDKTFDDSGMYNFWEACARFPESPRR